MNVYYFNEVIKVVAWTEMDHFKVSNPFQLRYVDCNKDKFIYNHNNIEAELSSDDHQCTEADEVFG